MAQSTAGQMVFWAWIKNTFTREPAKRASAIAVIGATSAIGSIAGSLVPLISRSHRLSTISYRYVWPLNWGPTYRYSYTICLAALGVSTAMLGIMHLHLKRVNEQIEKIEGNAKDVNDLQEPVGFRYLV
jgi:hypothetical protein